MNLANAFKALKPHVYYYQFGKIHFHIDGNEKRLSPSAIVLLSQLLYWDDKKSSDLGVYKTKEEWEDELGISSRRIDSAREELSKAGILTETKEQFPVRIYYSVNMDVLETYLEQIIEEGFVSIECEAEEKKNTKPTEESIPSGWVPSDNLIKFRKILLDQHSEYASTDIINASGEPTKYWYYVDGYIDALIKGEFVSRFGSHFTNKVKELSPMSFEEIIDVAMSVCIVKKGGKPNANDIFWVYGGKFSRFVNKYYQLKPNLPDLNPEKLAKWKEKYSYLEDPTNGSYGITHLYGKIGGLTKGWDYLYYIADRIDSIYDDDTMGDLKNLGKEMMLGQRKAFAKFWLEAYRDYSERMKKWKKDSKYPTLTDWLVHTKVGDSDMMTPWYLTTAYIYRVRGWWITQSKTAQGKIKEFLAKEKEWQNGGY